MNNSIISSQEPSITACITADQIKTIMQNCSYDQKQKQKWVKWVTKDQAAESLRTLSFKQAERIIFAIKEQKAGAVFYYENWGAFKSHKPSHRLILSLLHQIGWVTTGPDLKDVVDLERFSNFLKSSKSPVNKPLQFMNTQETSKVIIALKGILRSQMK
jgi:hypothetical protein